MTLIDLLQRDFPRVNWTPLLRWDHGDHPHGFYDPACPHTQVTAYRLLDGDWRIRREDPRCVATSGAGATITEAWDALTRSVR